MVEDDTKTCMNLWIEVAAGVHASGAILNQHYARFKKGGESGRWTVVRFSRLELKDIASTYNIYKLKDT
jgi:hypothetical protein